MKPARVRVTDPIASLALVAFVALVGAACSSSRSSSAGTSTPATAAPSSPTTSTPATTNANAGASFSASTSSSVAGTTSPTTAAAATSTSAPVLRGDITVFAAASLTDAFTAAGDAFMKANPDVKVTFTFDASSALAAQITQGAPADVFASADVANMDKMTSAGLNGSAPTTFATNVLEIIVEPDNPKGITGLADLVKDDVEVILCDPKVPCGAYAQQSLAKAGVTLTPLSLEQNVKGVVAKVVTAHEADAGIVYATDVKAAGEEAAGVEIPAASNVVAAYPIAATKSSKHLDVDRAFITFLTGGEGQSILASFGFGKPAT